jgi:glutathione S-transferase
MLTLFHSPGSCSNGILYLLNEIGMPHEVSVVNVLTGEQKTEAYLSLNPKGKVPALRLDDDAVLTEFQTIAFWLARSFPKAGLWPDDVMKQARTLEALDFIVGSVHMRGRVFIRMPQKFLDDVAGQASLQAHGRQQVENGLAYLEGTLDDRPYLLGDFGIADAAALYILDWAIRDQIGLSPSLAGYRDRLHARPAFAASAAHWGPT